MCEDSSYYDWKRSMGKSLKFKPLNDEIIKDNVLGISKEELRKYLKEWRKKNL